MSWAGLWEFVAMGGYGLYVWGAWGGALLLMAAECSLATRASRQAAQEGAP
jgi:heme exporter protein D